MKVRIAVLAPAAAMIVTLASSEDLRKVNAVYPGSMDCEQGCQFVAGGWPFPYLVDHRGISPTGSVSLVNGFIGVDLIWGGSFLATFAFWLGLIAMVPWVVGLSRWPRCEP